MKKLGITQRVEYIKDYAEYRDSLDRRWTKLALTLGFMPVPLANVEPSLLPGFLDQLQLDAIILSGGNTLSAVDAKAPDIALDRDRFESALIDQAVRRKLPLIGVCRGMQMINVCLGGHLTAVKGHGGTRHQLRVKPAFADLINREVNSFHNWTIAPDQLAEALEPIAHDQENNIEAFVHKEHAMAGIMWHPERESPFNDQDMKLLKRFLL